MISENRHHDEHIATVQDLRSRNSSVIDQLAEILIKGEAAGVYRSSIDPFDLHANISSLSFYNMSTRHPSLHNLVVGSPRPPSGRNDCIRSCNA
ncbi:hypothetical protein [Croceicoccus marinus]|uniref:hypothetical protein n=1 Tax=Croceicoccus marinus TaxID=450378 RepID=UPI0039F53E5B